MLIHPPKTLACLPSRRSGGPSGRRSVVIPVLDRWPARLTAGWSRQRPILVINQAPEMLSLLAFSVPPTLPAEEAGLYGNRMSRPVRKQQHRGAIPAVGLVWLVSARTLGGQARRRRVPTKPARPSRANAPGAGTNSIFLWSRSKFPVNTS